MMESRLTYIHQNPVRAGWVEKEDEYLYGSASNYTGLPAFIAVDWIGRVYVWVARLEKSRLLLAYLITFDKLSTFKKELTDCPTGYAPRASCLLTGGTPV